MSRKARKFLITTEEHEILIVRHSGRAAVHAFCPSCKAEIEMRTFNLSSSSSTIKQEMGRRASVDKDGRTHSRTATGLELGIDDKYGPG